LLTDRATLHARQVIGVITGALLLVVLVRYLTRSVSPAFSDLCETSTALLAAVSCALAARSASGRLRVAWAGLAGAALSWAAGDAIWSWYELVQHVETPFPGLADLGYLGFPLGAVIALAVFPSNVSRAHLRRMTFDGLLTAAAFGLLSTATALGVVYAEGADSVLAMLVSVAYPISDIVLLVVAVLVLSRSRAHRLPLGFIAAGLALMAVADSGFAYLVATGSYDAGDLIDLGWFFAFGMLTFATLMPGATVAATQAKDPAVAGTLLPYLPLGGAILFLGWEVATGRTVSVGETVLAVTLVLLVLLRQFLTGRDNQLLARALAVRESQLHHQAFHDQLTGLANRALFVDRVEHALALHRRDQRPLAICFLDLDGLKGVNDALGHRAGDDLLREAAVRFRKELSEADTLARFGGDEFAVLLENEPDPVEVGRALLGSLRAPFALGGHKATVLASIGIAHVDLVDPTPSVDELLMRADQAMYVVKRRGKADVLLHTPELELEEVDDVMLGRALAQALTDRELTLSFQPIVDLSTGRLDTLEALARWAPGGRPVSPEVFVRVAESCHLIDDLFHFVLVEACDQLVRWSALPGGSNVRVAVNVTPGQLSSTDLPVVIDAELARHGLGGNRLVVEIIESGKLVDTLTTHAVCHDLRRLGVQLSVDDFGSGLGTLTRLRDLPINQIKVDRSFISNLDHDDARRRFVWGVIAFAERVGVNVVADGVEREGERDALTDLGCHLAQGFLFSKPVPPEAVDALLGSSGSWLPGIHTSPT
jgi:diguanylate cyclase